MTSAIESWLTPLLFVSAPALMILSTAARYAQLHGEIHFLQDHGHAGNGREICNAALLKRAVYFRNASDLNTGMTFSFIQPGGCWMDRRNSKSSPTV